MLVHIEDRGYFAYYHWFIYMILAFKFIPKDEKITYIYAPYTEIEDDPKHNNFQLDSLKMMYPDAIYVNSRKVSRIEDIDGIDPNIKVVCLSEFDNKIIEEENMYQFLIEKFEPFIRTIPPGEENPYKRVYISRRLNATSLGHLGHSSRHILNEEEMMVELKKLGFVEISVEYFTAVEQFTIFKNAEIVLSPHGAALTNCMFAGENTNIVEVRAHDMNPCFIDMCRDLHKKHHIFSSFSMSGENFVVNVEELARFLNGFMVL